MLSLYIFFVIITFHVEATYLDSDQSVITFNIQTEPLKGPPLFLTCDYNGEKIGQNLYTVYEGGNFTILTKYNKTINHIICHALNNINNIFKPVKRNVTKSESTFTGQKIMGTVWRCEILAHRDNAVIQPVVYNNDDGKIDKYSAANCYMRIHVRQKVAPQTILVNNMELPAVRTNLSEKNVDFITEYQYADGDVVNVTCINKWSDKMLTMEYKMAGTMSDKSTMDDLSSRKMIGFETKLHSGHKNSYMICTHIEEDDYTKVMVKFVMRANFSNIVFLKINGMFLRPHFDDPRNNHYRIDYNYVVNQRINVTCEVERTDVKLLVFDEDLDFVNIYNKRKLNNMKADMSFYLNSEETNKKYKKIQCAIYYLNGTSAETVAIYFTAGIFPTEKYPLDMELPSNGRVMELYNDYRLHVIFYEFKDGETLQLTCGQLRLPPSRGPVLYLELDSNICNTNGCSIHKTLSITRKNQNTPISCYLKEKNPPYYYYGPRAAAMADELVRREIRVILRDRVLTTTTTPTTTSTTTTAFTTNHTVANKASKILTDVIESANQDTEHKYTPLVFGISVGAILVLLAVTVAAFCFIRTKKTKHIETQYGDLSNKSDISTSQHTKENENQYDLCHYSDHLSNRDTTYNTPESKDNIDPKYHHQYTEIDYLSCKPKICETQTRDSRVYDEPYVQITMKH